jgi:hypothetical protein
MVVRADMTKHAIEPEGLDVIPLDGTSWRVTDRELEVTDCGCLLAYVERRGCRYSVLMLGPRPGRHFVCASMEEALERVSAQGEADREKW